MFAEVFGKKSNELNHTFVKLESQSLIVRNGGLYGFLLKNRGEDYFNKQYQKKSDKIQKKDNQNVFILLNLVAEGGKKKEREKK